jgi:hypothetical protein
MQQDMIIASVRPAFFAGSSAACPPALFAVWQMPHA